MKIKAKGQFKETRLKKGYTIVGLASKVDMTKQALGQVERGNNGISPSNGQKLLEVLEVEFDVIFKLEE